VHYWVKHFGFYATISRLISGQILPQLLCRLAGDLASFGSGDDFYPRRDINGNHCHDIFQVSVAQTRSGFRIIIIIHKGEIFFTCIRAAKCLTLSENRKLLWHVEISLATLFQKTYD
jgi:hypothetical protein